jgi:CRP-like cAMP-binding protein
LLAVVKKGRKRDVALGEHVICAGTAAGEDASSIFIVCRGSLSCQVAGKEVKQLLPGRSFGELAVYFNITCCALREHVQLLGEAGPAERMCVAHCSLQILQISDWIG